MARGELDPNFIIRASSGSGSFTGKIGLDYGGTIDNAGINFYRGAVNNDGSLALTTNGTDKVTLINNGNVGIGTTNPNQTLTVQGNNSVTGSGYFGFALETINSRNDAFGSPIAIQKSRGGGNVLSGDEIGWLEFRGMQGGATRRAAMIYARVDGVPSGTFVPGSLSYTTAPAGGIDVERMIITSTGKIGLGINAPSTRLDVGPNPDLGSWISVAVSGNGGSNKVVMGNEAGRAQLGAHPTDLLAWADLYLQTGGGNVGIGTNIAPDQRLSVNGNASKTGGAPWATFSDIRLKKDIQEYTDGLEKVLKIRPVNFRYNSVSGYTDTTKYYVGVIAQEVQKIAPYMISAHKRKLRPGDNAYTDILQYDANALTYMLVNAIKEQQKLIESLQQENSRLMQKQSGLEKSHSSLQSEIDYIKQHLKLDAKSGKSTLTLPKADTWKFYTA